MSELHAADRADAADLAGAGASARDPEHAWNRGFAFWHGLFWASLAIGLVLSWVADDDVRLSHRIVATVAIVTLGGAYAVLRPSADDALRSSNFAYLAIVIVAVSVACGAIPVLSLLLTAGFSQMWLFSGPTRNGALLSGVLAAGALIGLLAAGGWSGDTVWTLSTVMLISLAISIGFGMWISRIIDQSRERADLIHELESARAELGAAHHAAGVMAERERVAREIHDTLAQGFTSVIMLSQSALALLARSPSLAADRLATIEDVARENLAEARALVAAFSPVGLEGSTLVDAVQRLADRFAAETGLAMSLELPAAGALSGLSRDREVVLLRAVQESLANVRRHAQATSVVVRVTCIAGDAKVEVTDNGVGFATGASPGYGLTGMQHRVEEAGGNLTVETTPGSGTSIVVYLPPTTPHPSGDSPSASAPGGAPTTSERPQPLGDHASSERTAADAETAQ